MKVTVGNLWGDFPHSLSKSDVAKLNYAKYGYAPKKIIVPPAKELWRIVNGK